MGRYKAQEQYDAKATKQIRLKLNLKTDADIIGKLHECGNMQGYIKELIRRDLGAEEIFWVRDRESGNEINRFTTRSEAAEVMHKYVRSDRDEGIYEPHFYEIYDTELCEVVEISE